MFLWACMTQEIKIFVLFCRLMIREKILKNVECNKELTLYLLFFLLDKYLNINFFSQ